MALETTLDLLDCAHAMLTDRSRPDLTGEEIADAAAAVGRLLREAGAANYIWATDFGEFVSLLGPPCEHLRRSWRGSEGELLSLLSPLPDDAEATPTGRLSGSGLPVPRSADSSPRSAR